MTYLDIYLLLAFAALFIGLSCTLYNLREKEGEVRNLMAELAREERRREILENLLNRCDRRESGEPQARARNGRFAKSV